MGRQKGVSLICSDLFWKQIGTNRKKTEQIGTNRGIPENKERKSEQIGRKRGNRNKSGWPPSADPKPGAPTVVYYAWWTFRIFFIFFCSGAGEREEASEEVAGAGTVFINFIKGVGGGFWGGGAGGGRARGGMSVGEGGVKNIFWGPKCPPSIENLTEKGSFAGTPAGCPGDTRPSRALSEILWDFSYVPFLLPNYVTLLFRINYVWCNVIVYINNGLWIHFRRCNSGRRMPGFLPSAWWNTITLHQLFGI